MLAPGEQIPGKELYAISGYLGQGAFAAAYRAANPAGDICFIKEYFPPARPSAAEEVRHVYATERDVVRRIGNYELCPRFWDAFEHEGYNYLVTDFIPGADLETFLKTNPRPPLETLVRWCVCLCHELAFLHSRSVVHHDLKPANIRLDDNGDPVIVDFSAAHWYRSPEEKTEQLYGSDSFLAPEYSTRTSEDLEAGRRMDVFAMGRILVELMVGERLSQDEIDQRHDQLYGQILHSGKLDIAFVRAIFRAVSYDPARRYASGIELAEDIMPAAPPVGRVRPPVIDLGTAAGDTPIEQVVQAYNVGGGTLQANIGAEGDWLEVGASGSVTGKSAMFERNRQTVRVIAHPERLAPGKQASGRIVFTFLNDTVEVPVFLRRAIDVASVTHHPEHLRIGAPPDGVGQAPLTFKNEGAAATSVRLIPAPGLPLQITPDSFSLAPGARQEVTVGVEARVLGQVEVETELLWEVAGNPRPPIRVSASVRRGSGLIGALTSRLRKK